MYSRARASSAEPAGRGPSSTCLRTCSKARAPSKAMFRGLACGLGDAAAGGDGEPPLLLRSEPPGQAMKPSGRKMDNINVKVLRDAERRLFISDFFIREN